jgi:hypothetical protein
MNRARRLLRHLRARQIGALPCRVWLMVPEGSDLASQPATTDRAGVLTTDDLEPSRLRGTLLASVQMQLGESSSAERLDSVWRVARMFGERVLPPPEASAADRQPPPDERRLAREIDQLRRQLATAQMDPEQLDARARVWSRGARLVRGVTGSGKTSVLAAATALAIDELASAGRAGVRCSPRVLVTCPERALLPALRERIGACFTARTGVKRLPRWVEFAALPEVVARAGGMLGLSPGPDVTLQQRELATLQALRAHGGAPARMACDLVVLDEAHDVSDEAFELLARLAELRNADDPRVHAYFDDAQAMAITAPDAPMGLRRRWKSLGLRATGHRSVLLDEAYRTPLETLEPAFNLRLGSLRHERVADADDCLELDRLVARGKVALEAGGWARVQFAARRGGRWPVVRRLPNRKAALRDAIDRATRLVRDFGLAPEDVAVLVPDLGTVEQIEELVGADRTQPARAGRTPARAVDLSGTRIPVDAQRAVEVRTATSARGLEWPVTILVGWEGMESTPEVRAGLYVAMTRTQHLCMLVTTRSCTLADELDACVARSRHHEGAPHGARP